MQSCGTGDRRDLDRPKTFLIRRHQRHFPIVQRHDFRKIFRKPVILTVRVESQDRDRSPGHAAQLAEPLCLVGSVMNGQDRHRRIEAGVAEWQRFGNGLYNPRSGIPTLPDHFR